MKCANCQVDIDPRSTLCRKCRAYNLGKANKKHGFFGHPLYATWSKMRDRCNNENHDQYKDYGGRGITICDEWDDPWVFVEWYLQQPAGDTVDRIDNDKGYSPDNCRLTDRTTQARNSRHAMKLELNGETRCLSEWCEIYNVPYMRTYKRLKRGWELERALTE